ncbi:YniB family protein [Actinobacillus pleuropneumoniae]|nr:YniB family protein [Actinobacillus pleuropneumoniae]EFL81782.1 hypothetical protein APP6_0961 [Actinobacillus pleuropneumoniae serovar 6 str. Femo]UKH12757.1 hypothetical protein D1099_01480 [Actinobacillus pleuropneumoniae serovar 6 str. Femo]UKH38416.1 hypothetical protein D1100_01480 [Actinobacillus pleuropneumoniae]UQZ26006.1 YniB family protein [Actinobacillus pleuropneumoniae]SUU60212.1 Uncharacterised protein [Actinobacillus pleuropneumoniae]
MDLYHEKKIAWCKIIIGNICALVCLMLLTISFLKMIYFLTDISLFTRPIKELIVTVYNKTRFLDLFWNYAPVPRMDEWLSEDFIIFMIIALIFILFMMLRDSGHSSLCRLKIIEQKIQEQLLEESAKGKLAKGREQIEQDIHIPKQRFLSSFHTLYIAPLIVGGILIFIEKMVK